MSCENSKPALRHIQNEAAAMIADWKKNGFNGVSFVECYMEPTKWEDWEGDGRTREEYESFIEDYAVFVAHPDLYSDRELSSKYENVEVDWFGFERELKAEMRRRLGDDIMISHFKDCNEYEIQRQVHSDQL